MGFPSGWGLEKVEQSTKLLPILPRSFRVNIYIWLRLLKENVLGGGEGNSELSHFFFRASYEGNIRKSGGHMFSKPWDRSLFKNKDSNSHWVIPWISLCFCTTSFLFQQSEGLWARKANNDRALDPNKKTNEAKLLTHDSFMGISLLRPYSWWVSTDFATRKNDFGPSEQFLGGPPKYNQFFEVQSDPKARWLSLIEGEHQNCWSIYPFPYHPWDWYIYLHDWLMFMVNVGRSTIHGCYGITNLWHPRSFTLHR